MPCSYWLAWTVPSGRCARRYKRRWVPTTLVLSIVAVVGRKVVPHRCHRVSCYSRPPHLVLFSAHRSLPFLPALLGFCFITAFRISVKVEWPKTTRDRAPSHDGGSMIQFYIGKLICSLIWDWVRKLRVCEWSITGWEWWEWIRRYSGLLSGSPHLCRLRTALCWVSMSKYWLYTDACGIYSVP
jgi:hypothetical protein